MVSDAGRVVAAPAELDVASAAHLGAAVLNSLERGARRLVVDLSGVRVVDSAGIGALLSAERRVRAAGGELVVANASAYVRRVFEVTGVARALTLE